MHVEHARSRRATIDDEGDGYSHTIRKPQPRRAPAAPRERVFEPKNLILFMQIKELHWRGENAMPQAVEGAISSPGKVGGTIDDGRSLRVGFEDSQGKPTMKAQLLGEFAVVVIQYVKMV